MENESFVSDCFENSEELTDCLRRKKIKCEHIHESFLELFEDAIGKNIAAKRSFINWSEKKPPTPSYFSGPFTLTKHTHSTSEENGWTSDFCVYIFGERHGGKGCNEWNDFLKRIMSDKKIKDEEKITNIETFLHDVADTSPVFLDIFIEMQRESRKNEKRMKGENVEYMNMQFLNKIRNIFRKGMAYIDDKTIEFERMENVRVHAIDERSRHIGGYLGEFYSDNFKKENLRDRRVAQKFLDTIETDFLVNSSDKFVEKFYMNDRIIDKEFKKLDKKYRDILEKHIMDSWELRNNEIFSDAYLYFQKHKNLSDPLDETKIFKLYDYFYDVQVAFMGFHVDMYFISRFLKGFNTGTEPRLPYNSIIYTGNAHSIVYREFFKILGFTEENLTRDDSITKKDALRYVEDDVIIKNETKNGSINIKASRCLHVNEKKMYPMFGVKSCGY
jgi:hypothetical protein